MSRHPQPRRTAFLLVAAILAAAGLGAQAQPAAPAATQPAAQVAPAAAPAVVAAPAPAAAAAGQPAQSPPVQGLQTFDTRLNPQAAEEALRQKRQPGNNAPVWREVRSGEPQYTSIPGREVGVLIQSGGQTWRERRNNQLIPAGALVFALVCAACAVFYFWRGTIPLTEPKTGRMMLRFTSFERLVHWTVAGCFSILAISGLTMAFGKVVLLPIVGHTLFAAITDLFKTLHNFVGPLFALAVTVMFFTFVKDNLPKRYDLIWLRKGGGLASGEHVPTGKFNAGEKLWFWGGVLGLGVVASLSGLVLDFPNFDQTRGTMQLANMVHVIGTMLLISAGTAHIYLGTLGMEGALDAMKTGYVDEAWAKEHHEYWYDKMKGKSGSPAPFAGGGPLPMTAPQAPARLAG